MDSNNPNKPADASALSAAIAKCIKESDANGFEVLGVLHLMSYYWIKSVELTPKSDEPVTPPHNA